MISAKIRTILSRSLLAHVGIYTVFGVLWITLSDRILLALIQNRTVLSRIQTYKGWFFILITSALLYFLMDRHRITLKKEKEEQEEILTTVPLPLLIVDKKGSVLLVNPAFTREYGYRREDIPDSETWFRKAYPDESYRQKVMAEWSRAQTQPQEDLPLSYIFTVMDKNGHEKITEFILLNRLDSQLIIFRDQTEAKKRMAETSQEDKMRALGQLAGGIAHDFNNQLCAIMGFTDLLSSHIKKGTDEYAHLNAIIEASSTAASLTEKLLSFSRKTNIEMGPVDMKELLDEIVHIGERTFPASIQIRKEVGTDRAVIPGNRSQLNSMLLNLLLNARDAMPDGGLITITLTSSWHDGDMMNGLPMERGIYLKLTVSDEGTGIAPEHLSHIFEPFYTTKERHKGSGMGLAMVYSTLQYHKGGIRVENGEGGGATFQLFFPTNLTVPG